MYIAVWTSTWYLDGPLIFTILLSIFDGLFIPGGGGGGGLEPKRHKVSVTFWQRPYLTESFETPWGCTLDWRHDFEKQGGLGPPLIKPGMFQPSFLVLGA